MNRLYAHINIWIAVSILSHLTLLIGSRIFSQTGIFRRFSHYIQYLGYRIPDQHQKLRLDEELEEHQGAGPLTGPLALWRGWRGDMGNRLGSPPLALVQTPVRHVRERDELAAGQDQKAQRRLRAASAQESQDWAEAGLDRDTEAERGPKGLEEWPWQKSRPRRLDPKGARRPGMEQRPWRPRWPWRSSRGGRG